MPALLPFPRLSCIAAIASLATAPIAAASIVRDEPLAFPAYAAVDSLVQREVRRDGAPETYERARLDRSVDWRRITYTSDGLEVTAFTARPAGRSTGARSPAIVFCRGSYVQQGWAPALLERLHRMALAGFVVIAPQYRGSEGGQGRDEMGGADVHDVLAALELVAPLGGDTSHVYFYGESRGGMMVLQALRDGAAVRAAATVGAFTDLDSLFAGDPRSAAFAPKIWPEWSAQARAIADRRSAVRWADALKRPLLLLHGRLDGQLSPTQSMALAAALQRTGTPYELHVVEGAKHTLGDRAAWRDSIVIRWFRDHAND